MMPRQIPVLYTEQKTKKVKIWLDGHLVPRATLNSARLVSAGKHEIDTVFYSSIDDLVPGREFETDRYLITVEEGSSQDQPCPRPSYAVVDPTMKNRPKSAGFIPPRIVPRAEPSPALNPSVPTWERQTANPWGYNAAIPTSIKRTAYECEENDSNNHCNYPNKVNHSSAFVPPKFQPRESLAPVRQSDPTPVNPHSITTAFNRFIEPPKRFPNETSMQNNTSIPSVQQLPPMKPPESPLRPKIGVSWSNWDESKSDDEDSVSATTTSHEEEFVTTKSNNPKIVHDWQSLVKTAIPLRKIENQHKPEESLPNFNFEEQNIDSLFDEIEEECSSLS